MGYLGRGKIPHVYQTSICSIHVLNAYFNKYMRSEYKDKDVLATCQRQCLENFKFILGYYPITVSMD